MEPIMLGVIIMMLGFIYKDLEEIKILIKCNHNEPIEDFDPYQGEEMILIDREKALSHPFANGKYDHKNANRDFIRGFESYKEWLEDLPAITIHEEKEPVVEQWYSDGRTFAKGTIDIRERRMKWE